MKTRPLIALSVVIFITNITSLDAASNLGCGSGGMKVITGLETPAIIREPDDTAGWGEQVRLRMQAELLYSADSAIPSKGELQQLYPLDEESAFTCDAAGWDFMVHPGSGKKDKWNYVPRKYAVYSLHAGKLSVTGDFETAVKKYNLPKGAVFLGFLNGITFYWIDYDIKQVFWKTANDALPHRIKLPRQVIDVFGVTKGLKKEYGFVVFRKSPGLIHYAPYTTVLEEFDLTTP